MNEENINDIMQKAVERARKTMNNNEGGPFGAVIVDKNNEIVSIASNQVLKKNDPTAHAEVEAIREACKKLGTHNLEGCTIYSSCEPCPMCLSAIIWANIKTLYYGATKIDAANIGFRDSMIYDFFEKKDKQILNVKEIDNKECIKLFEEYEKMNKEIY